MKRHVLSVLVENEPGVLSRVAGLFSGRGFNIDSLNVAPALEENTSRMTITTYGDSMILEQIMKQLHKIVSVIKVMDYSEADVPAVEREMMFVKVQAEGPARDEILRAVEIFRCRVVDVSHNEMTIEATGHQGNSQDRLCCHAPLPQGILAVLSATGFMANKAAVWRLS